MHNYSTNRQRDEITYLLVENQYSLDGPIAIHSRALEPVCKFGEILLSMPKTRVKGTLYLDLGGGAHNVEKSREI